MLREQLACINVCSNMQSDGDDTMSMDEIPTYNVVIWEGWLKTLQSLHERMNDQERIG